MDAEFAAKYPFSEKARAYLARENVLAVSTEELKLAAERVLLALRGQASRGGNARLRVVTFVLARIFLAAMHNPSAAARFAQVEAKAAVEELRKEEPEVQEGMGREFFPSLKARGGGGMEISVQEYLRFGGDLVNEEVREGRVVFGEAGFLQLLRRAMEVRIADLSLNAKTLPENIRKVVEELRVEVEKASAASGPFASSFKGKYLSLPAMQRIMNGLPEGKRYYGSMSLAIACLRDNLPREKAEEVMIAYARNCSRSTHDYTEREALATLEWVYRHPAINLSLKMLREQGLVEEEALRETEAQFRKLGGRKK